MKPGIGEKMSHKDRVGRRIKFPSRNLLPLRYLCETTGGGNHGKHTDLYFSKQTDYIYHYPTKEIQWLYCYHL